MSTRKQNDSCTHADSFLFALARLVRARAAALEALVAISRRCSGVIFLRRAFPPFLPISARYLETAEPSMRQP